MPKGKTNITQQKEKVHDRVSGRIISILVFNLHNRKHLLTNYKFTTEFFVKG